MRAPFELGALGEMPPAPLSAALLTEQYFKLNQILENQNGSVRKARENGGEETK